MMAPAIEMSPPPLEAVVLDNEKHHTAHTCNSNYIKYTQTATMEALEAIDLVHTLTGVPGEARDVYRGGRARAELKGNGGVQATNLYLVEEPNPALEWSSSFCTNCYCGKTFVRKVRDRGTFLCPVCQDEQPYKRKSISLHYHYFLIPLCRDHKFDDYVKCAGCRNHFQVDLLDWDQSEAKKALDNALLRAMLRIRMANGNTKLDTKSVGMVHDIYEFITRIDIAVYEILEQVCECSNGSIVTDLEDFVPFLSMEQKDTIIKAMVLAALADGDLEKEEAALLAQTGQVLGVSNKHVKEILHDEQVHKQRTNTNVVEEEEDPPLRRSVPLQVVHVERDPPKKNKVIPIAVSGSDPTREMEHAAATRELIKQYVVGIWNCGDLSFIPKLCAREVQFNGLVGMNGVGHNELRRAVQTIQGSLEDYHCEIHSIAVEGSRAFCRTRFSGRHTGLLLGYEETGKPVSWIGACEFTVTNGMIVEIWELGDMASLEDQLRQGSRGKAPAERHYSP